MSPRCGFLQRGDEIAPLAVFQHRVAQIAGGDEARGQLRDLAFLLFNDFVENVGHNFLTDRIDRIAQNSIFSILRILSKIIPPHPSRPASA